MAAKTPWWYCPKCGFANQPHPYRKDLASCEQCGFGRDAVVIDPQLGPIDNGTVDYSPTSRTPA